MTTQPNLSTLVSQLRERSGGAGIMDCKNALLQTNGDIEAALEFLRKSGIAKAAKKAGRIASEGIVKIKVAASGRTAVIVEFNCETDFVAKDSNFVQFTEQITEHALQAKTATVEALLDSMIGSKTVEELRKELVAKVGENIQIRRIELISTTSHALYHYLHGARIGVLVELADGNAELGKDIVMHIAASNPQAIEPLDVPADIIAKEKEIYAAQAATTNKPANIIEKMVEGRLTKYLKEVSLVSQPFVKDPEKTVGDLLKAAQAKVYRFVRFEVGEGIEKKVVDFAEEVKSYLK